MTGAARDRRRDNRGTGWIVIATALSALSVLVFQASASRALGPTEFAPIAALWTVMFLLYTVLMLPAEQHLTRALVVTRTRGQIAAIRRDMAVAFAVALVIGLGFTSATLDRFFEGRAVFVLLTGGIVATRALMATARGTLAGHRRFAAYGGTIALEASALLVGGVAVALSDGGPVAFATVMALAPLATLLANPFASQRGIDSVHRADAQAGSFLAWLIVATAASQMIIAGGPIAVSFVGGSAAAVSIFFTTFALLRGPVTSAYNLVARVLPDFTELAHSDDPSRLWQWAHRLAIGGFALAAFGALGAGLFLEPVIGAIYGAEFRPPTTAAILGGAGVGLGLGALFATQVYSAAALGFRLATAWVIALLAGIAVLAFTPLDPIERVALAFTVGEGSGLLLLGFAFNDRKTRTPS